MSPEDRKLATRLQHGAGFRGRAAPGRRCSFATCWSNTTLKRPSSNGSSSALAVWNDTCPPCPVALSQIARGIHEWLAEVDARKPGSRKLPPESAPARQRPSQHQEPTCRRDPGQLGKARRSQRGRGCEIGRGHRVAGA